MTPLEGLDQAAAAASAVANGIKADQLTNPTPCTEWDVRALVQHLVSENAWIPPLLAGKTIAEVGDRLDGDLLGGDPKAAWRRSVEQALAAIGEEGALDRTVHISRGDVPGGGARRATYRPR